jgi:hypothetical protein
MEHPHRICSGIMSFFHALSETINECMCALANDRRRLFNSRKISKEVFSQILSKMIRMVLDS